MINIDLIYWYWYWCPAAACVLVFTSKTICWYVTRLTWDAVGAIQQVYQPTSKEYVTVGDILWYTWLLVLSFVPVVNFIVILTMIINSFISLCFRVIPAVSTKVLFRIPRKK